MNVISVTKSFPIVCYFNTPISQHTISHTIWSATKSNILYRVCLECYLKHHLFTASLFLSFSYLPFQPYLLSLF